MFFLHEQRILHRDIKPSNILLKSDGHICLSDFGLAVDFSDNTIDEESAMVHVEPVTKGCAGTTVYMAPEALRGEYYGFKADWWSVGTTCYNLFEGIVRHFFVDMTAPVDRDQHPWPCSEYRWLADFAGVESVKFGLTSDNHVRLFVRSVSGTYNLERDWIDFSFSSSYSEIQSKG